MPRIRNTFSGEFSTEPPPPPDEGQSDDVCISPDTSRTWRMTYGGSVGTDASRQPRRRQPSHIYRTVVDNKIKYKGKVFTARSLKGKLDGKRFRFKHCPAIKGNNDEMMVLLSTAVVHEGSLRRLSDSIMGKFHEEEKGLIRDIYGDRIYEHWHPIGEKKAEPEVIVDPLEPRVDDLPMTGEPITGSTGDTSVDVSDWVYRMYHTTDANGNPRVDVVSPEPPRQLTPAEEARENDEPSYRYRGIGVGRHPTAATTILSDDTALFDDERAMLQRRFGIDTNHIVGSTRHYWIMDDGSIIDRHSGEIILNININDEPITIQNSPVPNPESHSTTLPDGSIMTDLERIELQRRGIVPSTLERILGSTEDNWLGRNFLINRHTGAFDLLSSDAQQVGIAHYLHRRGVNV